MGEGDGALVLKSPVPQVVYEKQLMPSSGQVLLSPDVHGF